MTKVIENPPPASHLLQWRASKGPPGAAHSHPSRIMTTPQSSAAGLAARPQFEVESTSDARKHCADVGRPITAGHHRLAHCRNSDGMELIRRAAARLAGPVTVTTGQGTIDEAGSPSGWGPRFPDQSRSTWTTAAGDPAGPA